MTYLTEGYDISEKQIASYKSNGFIKLKEVFSTTDIKRYNKIISDRVDVLNAQHKPLEERDTYGKAFLQIFNLWTQDEAIKDFVCSRRLAHIATQLMEVEGVRMYHDQALFKEAKGGITPWHADQYYWPLSSDKTITAWIPLQETPLEMGPLEFSAGSQALVKGRDLAISDESEQKIGEQLRIGDFPHVIEAFDLGEVSFHSGWVFHRAGANTTNKTRKVMTTIFMDKNMKLQQPTNKGQENDWKTWCPGAKVGEVIDTELNPVVAC